MSQDRPDGGGRPLPEAPTEAFEAQAGAGAAFGVGQVLGERYRVVGRLGAGGMGEVWRAFDLKLRVEVALKALRAELVEDESRLELLRSEVRAAREVTSPNVCRIFDLVELDGQELVSMEYVDGTTLLEVLRDKAPLDPPEAQEIASQFLAGLEAIHQAGLVHRDVKPENIMVTRTGRVVLMDFGLARSSEEGAGTVSGTPAYMAPEQALGVTDPRSDLFSAGVILAEMVSPDGLRHFESRTSVWNGIRAEPVQVPDSPWAPVVKRAVAKEPEDRFQSAHELTRALEEVAFRVLDETGLEPYPGLSAFTEDDAEYFFGREAEVEAVWSKLQSAQLLGIIGASGAGKSSFLGAGLIPARPDGWSIVRCTPGSAAVASLRRAVIPEIEEGAEALRILAAGGDEAVVEAFGVWRHTHDHALLIVDQFEELFTQNGEEEQARCAELLGRMALDADVHVLLSMRDDFLMRCHEHEEFLPMFSELTGLRPPIGGALRRAVVQPALRCGYRFEDEELADEILAEVEGERGALPLLAFALARLWEKRDRDNGLITRQAYRDIGGVGGAIAQHAETLMERLGPERHGIVRELFRNLVTAQGTRAARETDELLSVFRENRHDAAEVLHALIDTRLLTSYEVPSDDGPGRQRIEVIHESLLRAWPRLVRWQAQDAEGALLRDQLRQAAAAWEERGRPEDLLWTGSTYREYVVWRDRYPGGLTELEEAFVHAMTALAARRQRRRRIAATLGFAVLLVVLAVVTTLWRRSVLETRRAEAQKLLALGELDIDRYPTAALAWGTASLELADTAEGRQFVLRSLHRGPPVTVDSAMQGLFRISLSPGGEWLAGSGGGPLQLESHDGREPLSIEGDASVSQPFRKWWDFVSDDLVITSQGGLHRWWQLPNVTEPVRTEPNRGDLKAVRGDGYFSFSGSRVPGEQGTESDTTTWIHWWHLENGAPRVVGGMEEPWGYWDIDPESRWLTYARYNLLCVRSLVDWERPPLRIGEFGGEIVNVDRQPDGELLAALDTSGETSMWRMHGESAEPVDAPLLEGLYADLEFGPNGRWLAFHGEDQTGGTRISMVDLTAPRPAAPLELRRTDPGNSNYFQLAFHPSGNWVIASDLRSVGFWPLSHAYPRVLEHPGRVGDVAFTPDGRWLLSLTWEGEGGSGGELRAWPLAGQNGGASRVLLSQPFLMFFAADLALDSSGEHVAVGTQSQQVLVVPIAGGEVRVFTCSQGVGRGGGNYSLAFSPDGQLLAAVPTHAESEMVVQVWDIETGDSREIGPVGRETESLDFEDDGRLVWTGFNPARELYEERVLDLETGTVTIRSEGDPHLFRLVSPSGNHVLKAVRTGTGRVERFVSNLRTGEVYPITSHQDRVFPAVFDRSDRWLAIGGSDDGVVRVGPITDEESHALYGHRGRIMAMDASPDGRWIASGSNDRTVRLWPVPDLSKPPLDTLPHDELLARLKTLTNLRALRDEESTTGWKIEVGPFPGWATVPEW